MRTLIEKPPKYVLLVALSVATLRSTPCQGHDGPVHQKITASAAALSDGLSSFLGQNNASLNSPKFTAAPPEKPGSFTAIDWLSHGAAEEDSPVLRTLTIFTPSTQPVSLVAERPA